MDTKTQLNEIRTSLIEALKTARTLEEIREKEIEYLGRKGKLTIILRTIAELGSEEKKNIGSLANSVKKELFDAVQNARQNLEGKGKTAVFDVTLPGKKFDQGHFHPLSLVTEELNRLFEEMGFMVLSGPELESDYYCFEALNIPAYHPARDIQDTFYIDLPNEKGEYDMVMRTQTSSVQVRAMQKYGAPLRCVVPGRVFRSEANDATHDSTFYQIEGLMIDKGINIAHLISVMKEALAGIFKNDIELRMRPGHFPFTEPSLEVDIKCTVCGGKGCPACKNQGWLEMIGSGLVHPEVLRYGKIDPDEYTGFAFGLGLDRLAMMRYGITDIRHIHGGDLRFIKQF